MKKLQHFLFALIWPSPKRFAYAGICSVGLIFAMFIPLVNFPVVLAASPLFLTIDDFRRTGVDVEWSALGPVLKSPVAFACFFMYFALIAYLLLVHLGYEAVRKHAARFGE